MKGFATPGGRVPRRAKACRKCNFTYAASLLSTLSRQLLIEAMPSARFKTSPPASRFLNLSGNKKGCRLRSLSSARVCKCHKQTPTRWRYARFRTKIVCPVIGL